MTIELKLDTNSMNALFPEGSAARVDLQQAVIANFVRANIKPNLVTSEVAKIVEKERQNAVKQVLAGMGLSTHWNGQMQLSDDAKRAIELQARAALEPMINTAVAAGVKTASELIQPRINQSVEYETTLSIKRAVNAHVAKVAAELIK